MVIDIRTGADMGRAIAELRRHKHMTQHDLGELADLTQEYISKIESGRTVTLLEHELRILRRLGATITITIPDDHSGG